MAITDKHGLTIAVCVESASPHEVTLLEKTLDVVLTRQYPDRMIGDNAYDSDNLDKVMRYS